MIRFEKDRFIIEVHTGLNPIEDWLEVHGELIDLLQCVDTDMVVGRTHDRVLNLIREMMPDWDLAKKMVE